MPNVNIKYQLKLDATVGLSHLTLGGMAVTPANTTGGNNTPVGSVFVAGSLTIDLLMSGPVGQWTIAVWVIQLDPVTGLQIGAWKPLAGNGLAAFTNDVGTRVSLQGNFPIAWLP